MKTNYIIMLSVLSASLTLATAPATGEGTFAVVANADLVWKEMGVPGLASAVVSGDLEQGPCRFFLRYPAGFVTPLHHHSSDHYVAVISGTITLTVDGGNYRLGPGSYFSLTDKKPHVAKVEGDEDAVFFIQSNGPWDVVMED